MKTSFSSVVTPSPQTMLQNASWMLKYVSNIEKGERISLLSRRERAEFTPRKKIGNFHVSQQLLSMIVASTEVATGNA